MNIVDETARARQELADFKAKVAKVAREYADRMGNSELVREIVENELGLEWPDDSRYFEIRYRIKLDNYGSVSLTPADVRSYIDRGMHESTNIIELTKAEWEGYEPGTF